MSESIDAMLERAEDHAHLSGIDAAVCVVCTVTDALREMQAKQRRTMEWKSEVFKRLRCGSHGRVLEEIDRLERELAEATTLAAKRLEDHTAACGEVEAERRKRGRLQDDHRKLLNKHKSTKGHLRRVSEEKEEFKAERDRLQAQTETDGKMLYGLIDENDRLRAAVEAVLSQCSGHADEFSGNVARIARRALDGGEG